MRISDINESSESTPFRKGDDVFWFNDEGQLHRENDLPAIEFGNGSKEYWKNGVQYNAKPAPSIRVEPMSKGSDREKVKIINADGSVGWGVHDSLGNMFWYDIAGHRHRDGDLPAAIYDGGAKVWYKHGVKHRDTDNPALIWPSGKKEWYKDGKLHRDRKLGPAVINADGSKEWWLKGREVKDPTTLRKKPK